MAAEESDDRRLVARCRQGDDAAWAELVERYARYVHAICVQGFRLAPHDAEDAFQDAFTKAYEQLHTLRDGAALRPWLAQLTRRVCIDCIRRSGREMPAAEIETEAEDVLQMLDEAIAVRQALVQLGEPCSEVLDRFFARDESYHTIGRELDLPPGTIASRISRCLEKLKTSMEDSGLLARPGSR